MVSWRFVCIPVLVIIAKCVSNEAVVEHASLSCIMPFVFCWYNPHLNFEAAAVGSVVQSFSRSTPCTRPAPLFHN